MMLRMKFHKQSHCWLHKKSHSNDFTKCVQVTSILTRTTWYEQKCEKSMMFLDNMLFKEFYLGWPSNLVNDLTRPHMIKFERVAWMLYITFHQNTTVGSREEIVLMC